LTSTRANVTLPAMIPHMVRVLRYLDTAAQVRHLRVSLPLVACLVDGLKYREPEDEPQPQDDTERRQRAPRAPSMRTLVRWALRCDSPEQLSQRLRQRYERQAGRAGTTGGSSRP
jgi:hypothetical protein